MARGFYGVAVRKKELNKKPVCYLDKQLKAMQNGLSEIRLV
jgi:hypothetical protein